MQKTFDKKIAIVFCLGWLFVIFEYTENERFLKMGQS